MNEQSFHAPRRIAQRKFVPLVMIVLLVSLFSFVAVKNDSKSAYAVSDQSIMGGPTVSAAQLVAWFNHTTVKPYNASVPLATLASLYINEGLRYGIRGDIAFIQGIWETAWFSFINSAVSAGQNNFAGINCPSTSCPQSNTFADAQTGVRAQIQLLRNYADATSRTANPTHNPNISVIPDAQILPNFDTFTYKGAAPTWIGLNGKWAVPGSTYGQSLLGLYENLAAYTGVRVACPPDAQNLSAQTSGSGYWVVAGDGGVFSYGAAQFYGSTGSMKLNSPVLGMAATANGGGYWLVAGDGGIFSFGNAAFYGSTGSMRLNKPVVGMAATSSGHGYWLVASDGGIFTFGDAPFYGSAGSIKLNQPIVGMAPTPSGHGYWLVASDGGIFTYGDAAFYGSTGSIKLNQPIVGMDSNANGAGYWLVAADGGIFSFGAAPFLGGLGDCLGRRAAMMQASPSGGGYTIVSIDGRVTTLGDARNFGYPSGLNKPPVGLAVIP